MDGRENTESVHLANTESIHSAIFLATHAAEKVKLPCIGESEAFRAARELDFIARPLELSWILSDISWKPIMMPVSVPVYLPAIIMIWQYALGNTTSCHKLSGAMG